LADEYRADAMRGKMIRWTFTDGPMKDATFEHIFNEDGTVVFRAIKGPGEDKPMSEKKSKRSSTRKGDSKRERVEYAAMKVADDVYAVSYLGAKGYTLTVVLNFKDKHLVSFASNEKEWYPAKGTFEIVEKTSSAVA
jgi:hypothetical protein